MMPETDAPSRSPCESPLDWFGKMLARLGSENARLVVLDGGPAGATGAQHFLKAHPERYFGFGSAYQSMVAAASGLASVGLLPVVTAPAAFFLKASEQVRSALAGTGVSAKIVGTQAGLDAGAAWQAFEDIAVFRAIAGMTVVAPGSQRAAELAMRAMLGSGGAAYLRLANGLCEMRDGDDRFEIGKGQIVRNGTDVTIVACGMQVERALEAAALLADDNIDASVLNLTSIKPIDTELLARCAEATGAIVATEDHSIFGGLGGAVAEALVQAMPCPMEYVAIKDVLDSRVHAADLTQLFGIGAEQIAHAAKRAVVRKLTRNEERSEDRLAAAG